MVLALLGCALSLLDSASINGEFSVPEISPVPFVRPTLAAATADSLKPDSIHSPVHSRLLPPSMSFMERTLWDEQGLFRSMGFTGPLPPWPAR